MLKAIRSRLESVSDDGFWRAVDFRACNMRRWLARYFCMCVSTSVTKRSTKASKKKAKRDCAICVECRGTEADLPILSNEAAPNQWKHLGMLKSSVYLQVSLNVSDVRLRVTATCSGIF